MELVNLTQNGMSREQIEQLNTPEGLTLCMDADGLALIGDGMELRGDFARMMRRIRPGVVQSEMLVKAAKLKNAGEHPLAVDATAGLGEDSLLLAAAGFRVQLYEYDPVIAALLWDALRRAKDQPELSDIVSRMELWQGDSITAMGNLAEAPDVILLDPMFPERQKSASVKKKFQLLQQLERPCDNGEALLAAAIGAGPRKIVIKRPVKGPYLTDRKPDYSLNGKAIRYDCLVFART